ncbi:putative reverse transcriptase domain-containing protein [Tanacetum coccineum]
MYVLLIDLLFRLVYLRILCSIHCTPGIVAAQDGEYIITLSNTRNRQEVSGSFVAPTHPTNSSQHDIRMHDSYGRTQYTAATRTSKWEICIQVKILVKMKYGIQMCLRVPFSVAVADKSGEVSKHANKALGSNSGTQIPKVVNVGLESFPTISEAQGIHSLASANEGPTPASNNPGMSTSYANVTGEPRRKALNFRTLFTPEGNGIVVVVSKESIRAISERFAYTAYGFFLGKRVAYPVFSSMDGLNAMLENGPWFIRNNPLILKKWNPDVNLLKEDVVNIPVWVKLHGVPVTAFSEDGLSVIATKLDTTLMLDSYTSDMCANCMVFGHELDECLKNIDSGGAKNLKKPSQAPENVGSSSHNTTPIAEKIDKIEKPIIDGQVTLVDDEGKPVEKVDYSGDHDSEDEVASVDNDMARSMRMMITTMTCMMMICTKSLLEQ